MPEAVIVDCLRTAVGRSGRGTLRNTRPDDLAAIVIRALLERYPQVGSGDIEDVILGCAMPEGEQGMNMARIAALRAGLPYSVPGVTINRFCSSGLQAIAMAADRIRAGSAEILIAGGAESMSMIPMSGSKFAPNPWFVDNKPEIYMGMGLTAEEVQERYGVTRQEADEFALRSHQNALKAQAEGKFDEEIVPVEVSISTPNGAQPHVQQFVFNKDEGPRADTSLEALAKLKPVFRANGTVTAGNSSQTSDGAAAALVMSKTKAKELGLKPKARFVSFAVGGVPPEIMGIGPVVAIPKALETRRRDAGADRRDRAERGVRGAIPRRDSRIGARPEQGESQWRRDRARPSPGLHRSKIDRNNSARNGTPGFTIRHGNDVCRRRPGRGRHLGKVDLIWPQQLFPPPR